jgi:phosphatidylserine/phosphatidylglycerophosphate/cardiolipin synthase-like enzyme
LIEACPRGVRVEVIVPGEWNDTPVAQHAWATAGSANLDNRSFKLSDEANLIVYGLAFAAEQVRIFEADKEAPVKSATTPGNTARSGSASLS